MDKNKIKLIVAIGVLLVAAAILGYYFMGRTAATSGGPAAEEPVIEGRSNRAIPSGSKK